MHIIYDLDSDLTNHIDLRVLQLDLRVTVYPDGGNRPVGVCRSTTSRITITESKSQIETSTPYNRSHRPNPIYISHMQTIRIYNYATSALIPLKENGVGYTSANQNFYRVNQDLLQGIAHEITTRRTVPISVKRVGAG